MERKNKPITSDMGWSLPDRITIKGMDFCTQILGKLSFGDMAWLEIMGKLPTPPQSTVFNALLVTLVEHGMTPMAMATRLTNLGSPDAVQASIAAGLLGMGSVFGGTAETAARMLQDALAKPGARDDIPGLAKRIAADYVERKRPVPGLGHPTHKPVDPRSSVLFRIAAENGYSGDYIRLMELIAAEAAKASGKVLPLNVSGAIGAIASELGVDWRLCRGIVVASRAVGLVGHLAEEIRNPIAGEIWARVDHEVTQAGLAAEAKSKGG